MSALKISMEQLIALHGFFAEAAAASEPPLAEICGSETEVEVLEVRCSTLSEFGESGMRLSDDLVASSYYYAIDSMRFQPLQGPLAIDIMLRW